MKIKIVGMMPVRNEDWIVGLSARVALRWCDKLVLLDHASTDRSPKIVEDLRAEFGERVHRSNVADPVWHEMTHRHQMFTDARCRGATHLAIIDADEVLTSDLLVEGGGQSVIRSAVEVLPVGHILHLPLYNLRGGINRYHNNGVWGDRMVSLAFADDPRLSWSGDKFHSREPGGPKLVPYRPIRHGQGGVMHLWGANERRLVAKHALYKVTERLRWPGKSASEIDRLYSLSIKGDPAVPGYGTPATWSYAAVPAAWWAGYEDLLRFLTIDAVPWQEAEVQRLVTEYGRERFAGLDLFGVV